MNYNKFFKDYLKEGFRHKKEVKDSESSDVDIWKDSNKELETDEHIDNFDVQGIPSDSVSKYSIVVDQWQKDIESMMDTLDGIYKYAAKSANDPNSGKIFDTVSKSVEKIQTELGSLTGSLRTLGTKVDVITQKSETIPQ